MSSKERPSSLIPLPLPPSSPPHPPLPPPSPSALRPSHFKALLRMRNSGQNWLSLRGSVMSIWPCLMIFSVIFCEGGCLFFSVALARPQLAGLALSLALARVTHSLRSLARTLCTAAHSLLSGCSGWLTHSDTLQGMAALWLARSRSHQSPCAYSFTHRMSVPRVCLLSFSHTPYFRLSIYSPLGRSFIDSFGCPLVSCIRSCTRH